MALLMSAELTLIWRFYCRITSLFVLLWGFLVLVSFLCLISITIWWNDFQHLSAVRYEFNEMHRIGSDRFWILELCVAGLSWKGWE